MATSRKISSGSLPAVTPEKPEDLVKTDESPSPLLGLDLEEIRKEREIARKKIAQSTRPESEAPAQPSIQAVSEVQNIVKNATALLNRLDSFLISYSHLPLKMPENFPQQEFQNELFEVAEDLDTRILRDGYRDPYPELFVKLIGEERAETFRRCELITEWLLGTELDKTSGIVPGTTAMSFYSKGSHDRDTHMIKLESMVRRLLEHNIKDPLVRRNLKGHITVSLYRNYPRMKRIGRHVKHLLFEPALLFEKGYSPEEVLEYVRNVPEFSEDAKTAASVALKTRMEKRLPAQTIQIFDLDMDNMYHTGFDSFSKGIVPIQNLGFLRGLKTRVPREGSIKAHEAYEEAQKSLQEVVEHLPFRRLDIVSLIYICSAIGKHLDNGFNKYSRAFRELQNRVTHICQQAKPNSVSIEIYQDDYYGFLMRAKIFPDKVVDLNEVLAPDFEYRQNSGGAHDNPDGSQSVELKTSLPVEDLF